MATFLLDTTTITHLRNGQLRVEANYLAYSAIDSGHTVAVASINVEEVLLGRLNYVSRARTPADEAAGSRRLNADICFLASFPLFSVTEASVLRYESLRKMKLNVGRNDLRLAALALELGATVVTDNARDFGRIPALQWVDWTK
jgi:tRNA(fMet)-specific endonuclease VapC